MNSFVCKQVFNLGVLFLESEALRSSENKIDIDAKLLVCLFYQRETDRGKWRPLTKPDYKVKNC